MRTLVLALLTVCGWSADVAADFDKAEKEAGAAQERAAAALLAKAKATLAALNLRPLAVPEFADPKRSDGQRLQRIQKVNLAIAGLKEAGDRSLPSELDNFLHCDVDGLGRDDRDVRGGHTQGLSPKPKMTTEYQFYRSECKPTSASAPATPGSNP